MRIAVVIVTYNSAAVIGECLRSLPPGEVAAVVVADNDSRDDSLSVAEKVPGLPLRTVQMGRNSGYAAAINGAVETLDLAELDAVFVLNPDCKVTSGSLAALSRALNCPGRGIVVPKLVNTDGTLQPSLRRAPSVRRALAEAILGRMAGRFGELITDERAYERPGPAAWATGAALFVSARAARELGPWDESFLLYSEETEYALRAADHGWSLWFEPSALIEHVGGESATDPRLAALNCVNRVRLFRRRRSALAAFAFYLTAVCAEGVRALTGRRTARACFVALVRPSRRLRSLA